jgi:mono/diheme cytochrome c family protein
MIRMSCLSMVILGSVVVALISAASAQVAPTAGDPQAGQAFALQNCSGCHVVSPRQATLPSVANVPGFQAIAKMRSTTEMSLRAFLATPHPKMPNYILTPNDTTDVIAYILSLRGRP